MPIEQEKTPTGMQGLFEVIKASCHAVGSAASALLETEILNRLSAEQLSGLSKMLERSIESLNSTVFKLQEEIRMQLSKHEERTAQQEAQHKDSREQTSAEPQKEKTDQVIYAGEALSEAVKQAEDENKPSDTVPEKKVKQTSGKPDEIVEIINKGISQMTEPDRYRDFLNTAAKFPKYSFDNIMLITMQKPEASELAGFKRWKDLGRSVNKGEKGIRIVVPYMQKVMEERPKLDAKTNQPVLDSDGNAVIEKIEVKKPRFKAVSVFDISQTNGRERSPLETKKFRVNKNNTEQLQKLKTSILEAAKHELAKRGGEVKLKEAEAIAYTVCSRYGIDAQEYRVDGMRGHSEHEIRESLELIRDVTAELTEQLDEALKIRREQEQQRSEELAQSQERERIERSRIEEKELQEKEKITNAAVAAAFAAALDNSVNASEEKNQDRTWENGSETVGEKISQSATYTNIPSIPQSAAPQNSKGAEQKKESASKNNTVQQNRSSSTRSEHRGSTYRVSEKDLGQRSSVRDRLKNNMQKVNGEKTREQRPHRTGEISIG